MTVIRYGIHEKDIFFKITQKWSLKYQSRANFFQVTGVFFLMIGPFFLLGFCVCVLEFGLRPGQFNSLCTNHTDEPEETINALPLSLWVSGSVCLRPIVSIFLSFAVKVLLTHTIIF